MYRSAVYTSPGIRCQQRSITLVTAHKHTLIIICPVSGLILTYSGFGDNVDSNCFLNVSTSPPSFRTRVSFKLPPDLASWYTGRPCVGVRVTVYGSDAFRISEEAGFVVDDVCVCSASGAGFLARDIVRVTGPDGGAGPGGVLVVTGVGASVANVRRAVQKMLRLSRGLANRRVVLDILRLCYDMVCWSRTLPTLFSKTSL
jgi:hypothetical protein